MGMAAILVIFPRLFIYTLVPPSYKCFIKNLALICQSVSEKMFEYYDNIHVYCPGVGADEPLVSNFFFRIIDIQSYCTLSAKTFLYMTF